jgi:hypothetical protein
MTIQNMRDSLPVTKGVSIYKLNSAIERGTKPNASLNLSQLVERWRWCPWVREGIEEARLLQNGLCNGEEIRHARRFYAPQTLRNSALPGGPFHRAACVASPAQTPISGAPEDFDAPWVGVQRTKFTRDSIGRFFCNTWDEATRAAKVSDLQNAVSMFDAIVVGSGMYGGYCAHQIWRRGGKVLVLEAGPFFAPEHGQNLARGFGFDPPDAVLPESFDGGQTRKEVWGIPWRGNQIFPRPGVLCGRQVAILGRMVAQTSG